jgi:hypothetical protein
MYNGWTNYETWNVNLWMDNDQGSYEYWRERAQDIYDNAEADKTFTREEEAAGQLADELRAHHDENMPEIGPSCYSDLLGSALGEVNWYEIAEHLIDEVDKEQEPAEEEAETE